MNNNVVNDSPSSINVMTIFDGNNENPSATTPSGSGRNVRSRNATGEALADAMLQIAAASRMRANATLKRNEEFSVSKCIRLLDQMEGIDQRVYLHALDMFESPTAREIFISLRDDRRITWLQRKCNTA